MSQSLDPNVDLATSHIGLEATNFQMAGHMLAIGIINDYHFLLSECSFAGASKNTQMVQRGSLAPRRMSGTFANICAMSSLGMPSIYIYRYLHWYVHCYTGPYSIFKYQFFTCLEESDPTDRK